MRLEKVRGNRRSLGGHRPASGQRTPGQAPAGPGQLKFKVGNPPPLTGANSNSASPPPHNPPPGFPLTHPVRLVLERVAESEIVPDKVTFESTWRNRSALHVIGADVTPLLLRLLVHDADPSQRSTSSVRLHGPACLLLDLHGCFQLQRYTDYCLLGNGAWPECGRCNTLGLSCRYQSPVRFVNWSEQEFQANQKWVRSSAKTCECFLSLRVTISSLTTSSLYRQIGALGGMETFGRFARSQRG
jgi:hypothetical protein